MLAIPSNATRVKRSERREERGGRGWRGVMGSWASRWVVDGDGGGTFACRELLRGHPVGSFSGAGPAEIAMVR